MRVFDEPIGQLADMHQPVLMHADIDERAQDPAADADFLQPVDVGDRCDGW